MASPKATVTAAMIGTGLVVVIANAAKGQAPPPRSILGLGVVYLALAGTADFAPGAAGPFAVLVLVGTTLTEGAPALNAVLGAVQGKGRLGLPDAGGQLNAGGATSPLAGGPLHPPSSVLAGPKAKQAVWWAKSQIGVPYLWGGEQQGKGFDCSGLCQFAYARAGVTIPRTSQEQYQVGSPVGWGQWLPGDLIFSYPESGGPGHVVMYVGGTDQEVVAAPHRGARVQLEKVSVFQDVYVGSRRIVNPLAYPGPHPPK